MKQCLIIGMITALPFTIMFTGMLQITLIFAILALFVISTCIKENY